MCLKTDEIWIKSELLVLYQCPVASFDNVYDTVIRKAEWGSVFLMSCGSLVI
jgi:hypothetical protein